jgi:hypothetical protein
VLFALTLLLYVATMSASVAQAYVEPPPGFRCFLNTAAHTATLEHSMSPADGATVRTGNAVSFSGKSSAPVTFVVASSPAQLSSPDILSGLGLVQPPASAEESPTYTLTSTDVAAIPRTLYWVASFSDAGFEECAEFPETITTAIRTLTVAPEVPTMAEGEAPRCVVPPLHGDSLRRAQHLLGKAHCRLGSVSRPRRGSQGSLVVTRQSPHPGNRLAGGARVAVKLGLV